MLDNDTVFETEKRRTHRLTTQKKTLNQSKTNREANAEIYFDREFYIEKGLREIVVN